MNKSTFPMLKRVGVSSLRMSVTLLGALYVFSLTPLMRSVSAQQTQPARIEFLIDQEDILLGDQHPLLNVKVKNTSTDQQQTFNLKLERYSLEDQEETRLVDRPLALTKDTVQKYKIFVIGTHSYNLRVAITDIMWPGFEDGTILMKEEGGKIYVVIQNLPVQPALYEITVALVRSPTGAEPLVSFTKNAKAGDRYPITVERPNIIDSLKEKYVTKESLLISIILGLVAILVAAVRDKISAAASSLLDSLGRYGKGRLAHRRFRRLYLNAITYNHKYLKLIGFNTAGVSRPLLEEVFVSLRIAGYDSREVPSGVGDDNAKASIPFETALRQYKKLVILGAPGAGKTTALSYALLTFAQNKGLEKFGIQERLLPLFVPLRRLTNSGRSIMDDVLDEKTQILGSELIKECPPHYFERMLKAGRCLVLLDGLDEVAGMHTHQQVARRIGDMIAAYPDNWYVVTCRVAGWRSLLPGEFAVLETQDFSREEIQRFFHGWHRAVITQSEYSRMMLEYPEKKRFEVEWPKYFEEKVKPAIEIRTRNLLGAVDSSNRILAIAVNPMLLSLISLVHYVRHILPRGRTILYSQCIDLLLDAWQRSKDITLVQGDRISAQQKETVLREIAFEFQRNGVGEYSRKNLENLIEQIARRLGINVLGGELLEEIELRSGLLIERSIDVFGFSHLTLQEYLVAKHIQMNPTYRGLITGNIGKQEWLEVTLLYAGLLDDATELVREIAGPNLEQHVILAGRCIGDAQHCDASVSQKIISQLLERLRAGVDRDQVIEALSAVAADFEVETTKPEQQLAGELIQVIRAPNTSTELKTDCMAILARAKVTKSLSLLINLLVDRDWAVADSAMKALISFGNLALPAITQPFNEDLEEIAERTRGYDDLYQSEAMRMPSYDHREYPLRAVDVLRQINTTASAKALMSLYKYPGTLFHQLISLSLSQMLANPFIESDLMQIEAAQFPRDVTAVLADGEGWPFDVSPTHNGFLHLDTKIRHDLAGLIAFDSNAIRELGLGELDERLRSCSFKILFPLLLAAIRYTVPIPKSINDSDYGEWVYKHMSGMPYSEADRWQFFHLASQIYNDQSITLQYALRRPSRDDNLEGEEGRRVWKRITVWAAVAFMVAVSLLQLSLMAISGSDTIQGYETLDEPLVYFRWCILIIPSVLHLTSSPIEARS